MRKNSGGNGSSNSGILLLSKKTFTLLFLLVITIHCISLYLYKESTQYYKVNGNTKIPTLQVVYEVADDEPGQVTHSKLNKDRFYDIPEDVNDEYLVRKPYRQKVVEMVDDSIVNNNGVDNILPSDDTEYTIRSDRKLSSDVLKDEKVVDITKQDKSNPKNSDDDDDDDDGDVDDNEETIVQSVDAKDIIDRAKKLNYPTKFVTFDLRYGRLNNHVWSFLRALEMSKYLNRTLIISTWGCTNYPLYRIFNTNGDGYYKILFVSGFDMLELNENKMVEYYFQKTHKPKRPKFCTNPSATRIYNLRPGRSIESFGEIIQKYSNDDRLVAVNLPFRWRTISEPEYIFKHLEFPLPLVKLADGFIKSRFGSKPFVAVHLRHLEGKCSHRSKNWIKEAVENPPYLSEKHATKLGEAFCNLDFNVVAKVAKDYGFEIDGGVNEDVGILVAGDGQRQDLLKEYKMKGSIVRNYRGESEEMEDEYDDIEDHISRLDSTSKIVFDMVLLSKGGLFIGSPHSSFAKNVKAYRLSRGRDNNWLGIEKPFIIK